MVVSHWELAATRSAAPADVDAVTAHVDGHGLSVDRVDAAARSMTVSGTVAQFNEAFGVRLGRFAGTGTGGGDGGGSDRGRVGPVQVPATLAGVVAAVLGLDDRPQAQPHFRISPAPDGVEPHAAAGTFRPDEVGRLYQFPAGVDGTGQTIAIIELGGGFRPADVSAYFAALGITKPKVVAVGVDGARNTPVGDPSSADGEVLLDIDVVGAIAPGAVIAVYFGPNTTRGFYDAVAAAIHDTTRKPSAVSISWGGPESTWTAQALDVYDQLFADAAALGITVTAASGDDGSGDRVADGKAHVDFPASSPNVLACGGTRITANGTTLQSETVWNNGPGKGATGGGVSDHFALPAYQQNAGVPPSSNPGRRIGRGVPDVAGNADPKPDGRYASTAMISSLVARARWHRCGRRSSRSSTSNSGDDPPTIRRSLVAGHGHRSAHHPRHELPSRSRRDWHTAPGISSGLTDTRPERGDRIVAAAASSCWSPVLSETRSVPRRPSVRVDDRGVGSHGGRTWRVLPPVEVEVVEREQGTPHVDGSGRLFHVLFPTCWRVGSPSRSS